MHLGNYIKNISRDAVVDGVKNIKRYYLPSEKLLSDRNPLITNATKSVWKHADSRTSYRIKQSKINSFLAASSLAHMLDGWMYLSQGFNSVLAGDEATAIHLTYYAELRSAMSILATEGLGVFSDKHLGAFSNVTNLEFPSNYYKGSSTASSYKQPKISTHQFVWSAMEKWTNSAYKPNIEILKVFKVNGKNFYELTEYFHPTTAGSTLLSVNIVKAWLKEWCLDIQLYRNDREIRNEVSYRPQNIDKFRSRIDFKSILNDLNKYWLIISPSNTDKFGLLDRYLLRKLYDSLYGRLGTSTPKIDLIRNAFIQNGINDETLFGFLDFQPPYLNDHSIFTQANNRATTSLPILARATLLLRISVGLVSQLFKDGGIAGNELNFVWDKYGINGGFWENNNQPTDFSNLWFDIQPSIDELITNINSPGLNNTPISLKQKNYEAMAYFGQINRASLWGIDF